jgi:hypothetical protein
MVLEGGECEHLLPVIGDLLTDKSLQKSGQKLSGNT